MPHEVTGGISGKNYTLLIMHTFSDPIDHLGGWLLFRLSTSLLPCRKSFRGHSTPIPRTHVYTRFYKLAVSSRTPFDQICPPTSPINFNPRKHLCYRPNSRQSELLGLNAQERHITRLSPWRILLKKQARAYRTKTPRTDMTIYFSYRLGCVERHCSDQSPPWVMAGPRSAIE